MRNFIVVIMMITSTLLPSKLKAQHLTHDVGFHLGVSSLQTDYGVRRDFLSNFGNRGMTFTLSHSVHFFNNDLRWNYDHPIWSHTALKTEIGILTSTRLKHFGRFVERDDLLGNQLRAMTGNTSMVYIGMQIEYYFNCLKDFLYPYTDLKLNPYVLIGFRYNAFKTDLQSSLGDWRQDPSVLPTKWQPDEATFVGNGVAYSTIVGSGIRYKLTPKFDLNLQFSFQYFFSDSIDGLRANVIENQDNETSMNLQLGVIYHLNFAHPLRIFD